MHIPRPLLIASIGNPGRQYAKTPHSAGHIVINALLRDILSQSGHSAWSPTPSVPLSFVTALGKGPNQSGVRGQYRQTNGSVPISPVYSALFGKSAPTTTTTPGGEPTKVRKRTSKPKKIDGTFSHPGPSSSFQSDVHFWSLFQSGVYMNVSGPEIWRAWSSWIDSQAGAYHSNSLRPSSPSSSTQATESAPETVPPPPPPLPALVILHDELEADFGAVKYRKAETSARGHRGLVSIASDTPPHMRPSFVDNHLAAVKDAMARDRAAAAATPDTGPDRKSKPAKRLPEPTHPAMMYKIGIGIGRPDERTRGTVSDYVLGNLTRDQYSTLERAADGVAAMCRKISRGEM